MLRFLLVSGFFLTAYGAFAQQNPAAICENAARAALEAFKEKGLKQSQIAISLNILDRQHNKVESGSFQGNQGFYPASVVKLFYIVYAAQLLQDGKLKMTPEFERAAQDMVVDSSNDATALVMDTVTGTTGGPELPPSEFKAWQDKRNVVNRYFAGRGYVGINVNQKTWNEGPYGRERQSYGPNYENRNNLTADTCVRLMTAIAQDSVLEGKSKEQQKWTEWIKRFLLRTVPADDPNTNEQAKFFIGKVLPKGSQLWSKAGWMDTNRHDVAWVKLPDGKEFVLSIFTQDHSQDEDLIPFVAGKVLEDIEK
jgi:beta-lactamase class A